jgi:hypothetical protein
MLLFDHTKQNQFAADTEFIIVFFCLVLSPTYYWKGEFINQFFPICQGLGTQLFLGFFPEVNSLGHNIHHLPVFSNKIKNDWSYTSASLCAFMTWTAFLDRLSKLRKTTISLNHSVHGRRTTLLPTQIFMKFDIWICLMSKIQPSLKSDKNNLCVDLCKCVIFHWIILGMWNVPDKSCRESQNTHFMFSNFSAKIVLFIWYIKKYGRARQVTGNNIIYVICMLDN